MDIKGVTSTYIEYWEQDWADSALHMHTLHSLKSSFVMLILPQLPQCSLAWAYKVLSERKLSRGLVVVSTSQSTTLRVDKHQRLCQHSKLANVKFLCQELPRLLNLVFGKYHFHRTPLLCIIYWMCTYCNTCNWFNRHVLGNMPIKSITCIAVRAHSVNNAQ